MNMFLHELKAYRKSTIIWTCTLVGLILLFMSMYPTILKDITEFKKLLEGYPLAVRKALGISIENVASILGFYSYVFGYVLLCGAIQAMNLGTSIISKEVREKTADFLLTKPVTRSRIITSKFLAAVTCLAITNIVYLTTSSIIVEQVKTADYNAKIFFLVSITLFFLQLIFLALGVIVSVVMPKIRSVLPVSLGAVFTFFIIGMLNATTGDDALRYISPFKYFDPAYIIKNSSYEAVFVIISVVFIAAAILASYVIYSKKDIHAV